MTGDHVGAAALGRLLRDRHRVPAPAPGTGPAAADPAAEHVPSRPHTVVWGHLPPDRAPVVTVASGARVDVDTVSHQGLLTDDGPVAFFARFGVPADEVLADAVDIHRDVTRPDGAGGHVLTGPIHVEGVGPGDALEVRVVDVRLRVPYGVNHAVPGGGVLPDLLDEPSTRLLRLAADGRTFAFAPGIAVPAAPFPGIVAVAPPGPEPVSSRPPGRFGGNLDLKELTAGARLFLPVFAPGGQLYVGDPHAAQGDGEVNGTAIEHSSAYTLELVAHRGLALDRPAAETATHWIATGADEDLDEALRIALGETVGLLAGLSGGTLAAADAYALASLAVDFEIAEAVNRTKVVHGMIPKALLT